MIAKPKTQKSKCKEIPPMAKYDDLLLLLEDNVIYSSGLIVQSAEKMGYATAWEARLRIRISLNTRTKRQGFPTLGDGWVKLEGQGPTPGWFGWRWKMTVIPMDGTPPNMETPTGHPQGKHAEHCP